MAIPWSRRFFLDADVVNANTGRALYDMLVRIPLGTALAEELLFRGALLGLFMRRHRAGTAVALSSALFGLWHVSPTLSSLASNPAASAPRINHRVSSHDSGPLVTIYDVEQDRRQRGHGGIRITERAKEEVMKVVSHRGGRGFGPDNTLGAMEEAFRAGVSAIETDVRATADGELIISHDPKVDGHHIARTPFAVIRRDRPDRPLLREILDSLAGKVSFNIEIKIAPPEAVGEILSSYGILEDTLVTSFRKDMVEGLKRAFPAAHVGSLRWALFNGNHVLRRMKEAGVEVVALHCQAINEDNVFILHGLGLEVHAWTVNEEKEARRLHALGVDCLITDHYLDMVRLVEELDAGG